MTISDYASLLVDAGEYSGRDDVAHLFPRFVGLAEAKFNRALRVGDMEVIGTIALTEGDADLPDDFLEAREVLSACGRQLRAWSVQSLSDRFGPYGGPPAGYAIVGKRIMARPKASENITVIYYGKIPPLTPQSPTNWLLEKAPDVYLYGLVEEIAIWEREPAKVQAAQSLRVQAMQGLALLDERMRWGNSRVTVGGPTP
ncbi:MAG: hypothetical protein QHC90_25280 [Shinella sp.]|nr:hypothetical protein [Shinella sp.]